MSATAIATGLVLLPAEAAAQASPDRPRAIDISSRTLRSAVDELAREAHVSIGAEGVLPQVATHPVHATISVSAALDRILAGTGWRAVRAGPTAWRIERAPPQRPAPAPAPVATSAPAPVAEPGPPIIVTASKDARELFELPMALARVDLGERQPALAQAGSTWAAQQVEGLAVTASGPGRNRMFLRGVADSPFSGESQSTVAILLDSARITYAAPDPDIRLVDVARVEVLKGPQGSLYGAGALGGIYQVHTNRPLQGTWSLATSAGVEAVAHGDLGYGGTVVANLPLAGESVALRLVGYGQREAGWVDTGNRSDSNSLAVTGARAMLGIEAGGGWQVDLSGLLQNTNSRDSQYVYQAGSRARPAQLPEPHDNDITVAAVHASGPLGGTRLTLDGSQVWHEVRDTFDATQGAGAFAVTEPRLLHDDREYRIRNGEARLDGTLGPVDWLVGLSRIEARQTVLALLESATDPAAATLDDDRRKSTENALFATLRVPLGAEFKLEAGGRLFSGVVRDARLVGGSLVTRDLHRQGLTPSGALSWQAEPGRLIYLRYGSALRQGGVDIGSNGELEEFDSDELATLEAGWREDVGGMGRLDLGLFATRWLDMQSDMLLPNGLIETMNVGNARIVGVEASGEFDLGADWHLAAGGTLVDGKLVRDESGLALDDRHLPVVPDYTLRGGATRGFAIGAATEELGLSLFYMGRARLSFDPALDRPMGNVITGQASARIDWGDWQADLAIDNLFGCRDDTFALGNRLRILAGPQFTPLRPRRATFAVSRRF